MSLFLINSHNPTYPFFLQLCNAYHGTCLLLIFRSVIFYRFITVTPKSGSVLVSRTVYKLYGIFQISILLLANLEVNELRDLNSDELKFYIEHLGPENDHWKSAIEAAVLMRLRELGINNCAFEDIVATLGVFKAFLSVIIIDRNTDHPKAPGHNPGGVLRAMTARHRTGELNLDRSVIRLWKRDSNKCA